MKARPKLHALADRVGIMPGYEDITGVWRDTPDRARTALLEAMGIDASNEQRAHQALQTLERRAAACALPPTRIVRARSDTVRVRTNDLPAGRWAWTLRIEEESGPIHESGGKTTLSRPRNLILGPSVRLPLGYHTVRLTLRSAGRELTAEQLLVMTPRACLAVRDVIGRGRLFGVTANLYTLRNDRNWGAGDLGDLRELLRWSSRVGAAFVGINPLHALRNRGGEISPYSPVSRLFRNPLYLAIAAIPEYSPADEADDEALARLRATDLVDYEGVMARKEPMLRRLHRRFRERHRGRGTVRGRAYTAFCRSQGQPLEDFATFLTLETWLAAKGYPRDWRRWPATYRDSTSDSTAEFRERFATEIDYHRWVQFELDRQLGAAAAQATSAGMAVGLYGDLAIGSAPSGSDPWAFSRSFVEGASVGAPPDDYSATGQDWGVPAVDPAGLAADRYRYWILLTRNALTHVGALRIDHVMGLFRQFWIPAGRPGTEGAYVRYPAHDLLGILALESHRQHTLVIGEDLGTVPRGLSATLARWGILSTRVLYFERTRSGGFRAAKRYSPRAIATATTHDHPPLAGFWLGRDLDLRRAVRSIPTDQALHRERQRREHARKALVRRLRREGILAHAPRAPADLIAAVHTFLARTPAPLVGASLDDLASEVDPVNVPGVQPDRYPSWSRRMRQSLPTISSGPTARALLGGLTRRARQRPPQPPDRRV